MNNFEERLEKFLEIASKKLNEVFKDGTLVKEEGKKYIRIVHNMFNGQRCCHCFVNKENGDVLKADSWSKPNKISRGNIFSEDFGGNAVNSYGAVYLR